VFFRDTLRRLAELERVVEFARRGPEGAEVERVEMTEEPPEGLRGFSIR
jgi:hypothetical protein